MTALLQPPSTPMSQEVTMTFEEQADGSVRITVPALGLETFCETEQHISQTIAWHLMAARRRNVFNWIAQ